MGDEAHVFIKSNERRIHYNGTAFVVRNAGHSAGRTPTAPRTKNICFVGCVSKIMPNNFFVDGCGCQEVELRTSLTNGLSKI